MTTQLMTPEMAYVTIAAYAIVMLLIVGLSTSVAVAHPKDHFFVADRKLGIVAAAASVAVSWIWAPAIFFAGLKAYSQGMAGAFWFIVPNVLCFLSFAIVVRRMRSQIPNFYTLPDYMQKRFSGEASAHSASLAVSIIIAIVALLFNSFVGAFLLKMLTGIEVFTGIGIMLGIAVVYSVWRGFPASVTTDVVQMIVILAISLALVPSILVASWSEVSMFQGLSGAKGNVTSIFDPEVVFTFGVPATIALLAVPLADQMFYQRAVSVPRESLMKTFVLAGALFGTVPILLSMPGFVGAALEVEGNLFSSGLPKLFITVDVVTQFLPAWMLSVFVVLAICALSSTIDSALVGLALIWSQDVYGKYLRPNATENDLVVQGRLITVVLAVLVFVLAWLLQPYLSGDVLFNFNGAVASTIVGPLILAAWWPKITSIGVVVAVLTGLIMAIPAALWANYGYYVEGNQGMATNVLIVAVLVPVYSTICAWLISLIFPSETTMEYDS